jgi:propionyl-CoA synthetase
MNYQDLFQRSIREPEKFWAEQAEALKWDRKPTNILSRNQAGYPEWYTDGMLNVSYLCIDKHIEDGFGDQRAIIYDSPVTDKKEFYTFNQLREEVGRLAGGLQSLGIQKGDTVIIYMPMIPQAVFAMLACARIGAIHSVVFGGFAPNELAIRIDDCKPKAIITASNGIEIGKIISYKPMVDKAIEIADHKPEKVVIFDRKQGVDIPAQPYDIDFEELVADAPIAAPVSVESTHPLYILYTSGTTGKPKGIIRDSGGYATALKWSMKHIYGVNPGETYWAASDIGWVVGHSYIVYGPLLNRNTTIVFEGKPVRTPDAGTFWRVISEHDVKVMFTAPTAIRAIKREDPHNELIKKYDLSGLRYQFLAGERCDVATLHWAEEQLKVPVIDHWWQTESGWPMLANMVGVEQLPVKPGSAAKPVCGYDIRILDTDGNELGPDQEGFVVVKLPLPPGNLMNLWADPEKFIESYLAPYDGYYFSGDAGYKDKDGYVFITGRVDDIINVAGHRLSTAAMEEVVAAHDAVAECAVFGVNDSFKGEIPFGLVVLKAGESVDPEVLQQELIQRVRKEIGPVASFKQVKVVKRLPKTRSGKILRKLMRNIADKKAYKIPSTIDDVTIIDEIEAVFHPLGEHA